MPCELVEGDVAVPVRIELTPIVCKSSIINEVGFRILYSGFEACFGCDRWDPAPKVLGSYAPKTSALS